MKGLKKTFRLIYNLLHFAQFLLYFRGFSIFVKVKKIDFWAVTKNGTYGGAQKMVQMKALTSGFLTIYGFLWGNAPFQRYEFLKSALTAPLAVETEGQAARRSCSQ